MYKQVLLFQDNNVISSDNIIIQSKIIKNINDLNFVLNHLKKTEPIYNKKILYFNLLFRASEVGELEFDQTLGAIFNNKLFNSKSFPNNQIHYELKKTLLKQKELNKYEENHLLFLYYKLLIFFY